MVAMEFAGIAEAGGVKNVSRSLCEELARSGNNVTLFIPQFGCTSFDETSDIQQNAYPPVSLHICSRDESMSFSTASLIHTNIRIVFVKNPHFLEKLSVYTYTEEEEQADPSHKRGSGHADSLLIEALFQRAVALYGRYIPQPEAPDIVLCEDASTAVLPSYITYSGLSVFKKTQCVVTIHNAGPSYHHCFNTIADAKLCTGLSENILCGAMNGDRVEPFLLAAGCAALTTVSTQYAEELTDPAHNADTDGLSEIFARRSIHITGITNGIDYERYNPTHNMTSLLPFRYDPENGRLEGKYRCRDFFLIHFAAKKEAKLHAQSIRYLSGITRSGYIRPCRKEQTAVYFAYHGRIVSQKGIRVLAAAARKITGMYENARFVIIGQGEPELEQDMENLAISSDGSIIFFKGYNRAMARLSSAVCDFIVLPSYFEPCGLEDFIAQIFGTIPVAHATGGLRKIIDGTTGFLYSPNTPEVLEQLLSKLIEQKTTEPELFEKIIAQAAAYVHKKYSWSEVVSEQYIPFFNSLLKSY